MNPLTPEQLPEKNAQFIAYGAPVREPDPFGGEDVLSVRPQVFVRYYRGIKVRELAAPRNGSEDTVKVVFDPASVGLQSDFSAYMNTDDPVMPYLREQVEQGNPLDIGLEYVRRKKAKDTKAEISPVTPIHALRGAESPDGAGNNATMMGAAGNHVRCVVGLINGRRPENAVSDPQEWKILVTNRKGNLPPEGWKALLDREDWTRVGAIAPKGGAVSAPQGGTAQEGQALQSFDMNALAHVIRHEVKRGLVDYGDYLMREDAATQGQPTSRGPASAVEGKPWNTRVNQDHLNLGSYLVTGEGHALRWAYKYLGGLEDNALKADAGIRWEAAQELADATQQIADGVQAAAYNGEVRADRTSPSFTEAVRWVRFHVEETYPFGLDENFDFESWYGRVGRAATQSLKKAESAAFAFLEARNPKAAQETQQTTTQDADTSAATDEEAPSPDSNVLDAYLRMLTQGWTSKDRILTLAQEAREKNLLQVEVWADPAQGTFGAQPFNGAQQISIAALTKRQYELLNQAGQQQPESPEDPPAAAESTQQEQPSEDDTASPTKTGATVPQHLLANLARATTGDQIAAVYQEARDQNLLTSPVEVKRGRGTFGIAPVPPGTDPEAETLPLGDLFDALRTALTTDSNQPQQEEERQQEQPSEDDTASPEPQQQENQQEPQEESNGQTTAQQIADQGAAATTVEDLTALVETAQAEGLAHEEVTVQGNSGELSAYLTHRLKKARRARN